MMHLCAYEILILSLLANAAQAGVHVYLFRAVTQARALAHKFKDELDARPIKTIIYGVNPPKPNKSEVKPHEASLSL